MGLPYVRMCGSELESDHGAKEQRFVAESLIEMVGAEPPMVPGPADPPFAYMIYGPFIPAGAMNVLGALRVLGTINAGGDVFSYGLRMLVDSEDPTSGSDYEKLFGEDLSPLAGGVFGPESYDLESWRDDNSERPNIVMPFGGYPLFMVDADAFLNGRVRLTIFYSLLTPPTS